MSLNPALTVNLGYPRQIVAKLLSLKRRPLQVAAKRERPRTVRMFSI